MEGVERLVRPLQRAYFSCCYACTDDRNSASEVSPCVQRCVAPISRINEALGTAQSSFQQRMQRCHQVAGEAVPANSSTPSGEPTPAALAAYTARLQPCMEEELSKLDALLAPVQSAIPGALDEIRGMDSGSGSRGVKLDSGAGSKKWW